ncbi:putative efflux pump outer membrane protein TtgC [Usitatibacter rugosus]|uniref:Putative efflux pump outer membrane protein TtgC n=1 Tax=Usitatibacter rugosus TaxID=2732067 RepID=A0A6M4GXW9_9PROT|nr:efflux transporter outer membrane subunit [Usitatibacter rugosus]QJR12130.1 putative efflux pump outer membrane protein TtgC [Usitatibacter rugosus]
MTTRPLAITAIAALLAACTPQYNLPPTEAPAGMVVTPVVKDWWKSFQDPVLDQAIAMAFAQSPTLEAAMARVDASQARLGASRSFLFPSFDAQAGAGRARLSQDTNPPPTGPTTVYQAGLTASWEVDLWGRLRNEVAASRSDLLASTYARDAVELELASQVALTYFLIRSLDAQLDVARRTLESRVASYDLRLKRFSRGITSELDVRQAENELATARAAIPDIQDALSSAEGSFAALTGMSPRELVEGGVVRGKDIDVIPVPPALPEGMPSDLLLRRPDIQEAEQTLRAAQARIAGARAAYFPVIGLTGAYGGESLAFGDLFSGPARAWSFVGALTMPVFNSGRTAAQVDLATASERAAIAAYRNTVIQAFAETRSALTATRQSSERVSARQQSVSALRRAYRLANLRYDNGYSSYLDLLDAERQLFAAELSVADAQRLQLSAVVALYRALGGGWVPPEPPPKPPAQQ